MGGWVTQIYDFAKIQLTHTICEFIASQSDLKWGKIGKQILNS